MCWDRGMRLWSLHPSLLDRAALLAGWRETLLAQKVLAGGTKGYTNHPQLRRFRTQPEPLDAIGAYLLELRAEATARGYRFDLTRILRPEPLPAPPRIPVTEGQLGYELEHLRAKCARRSPTGWNVCPRRAPSRMHTRSSSRSPGTWRTGRSAEPPELRPAGDHRAHEPHVARERTEVPAAARGRGTFRRLPSLGGREPKKSTQRRSGEPGPPRLSRETGLSPRGSPCGRPGRPRR